MRDVQIVGNPPQPIRKAVAVLARCLHSRIARDSCVQSALATHAFLQKVGIIAELVPVSVATAVARDGDRPRLQKVGTEFDEPAPAGKWSGHLVVIADQYLIDPTAWQSTVGTEIRFPTMAVLPLQAEGRTLFNLPLMASVKGRANDIGFHIAWVKTSANQGWRRFEAVQVSAREAVVNRMTSVFRHKQTVIREAGTSFPQAGP